MIPFDFDSTEGKPGGSTLLDRILRRLSDTLLSLKLAVTNDHVVPATFSAATTDVQVFHGLKGPPVAWEVVDRDADAQVWKSATVNPRPRDAIILQASAPVTVKLRFS